MKRLARIVFIGPFAVVMTLMFPLFIFIDWMLDVRGPGWGAARAMWLEVWYGKAELNRRRYGVFKWP